MATKKIIISGNNISDLETFYVEIDRVITKGLDWQTGHNFNAFNDLLWGGFGIHDYEEPISLVWTNFAASKQSLGNELTEIILEIIGRHKHINFSIKD